MAEEHAGTLDRLILDEQIVRLLLEIATQDRAVLGGDPVDISTESTIADIGIDSIGLSYVFAFAEREYGASFDNNDLDIRNYPTVADLTEKVWSRVASGHA
jgi:acyl carrier protein